MLHRGCFSSKSGMHFLLKLADYYDNIRLIMLHKLEVTGQSTCFASTTCDASLIIAINLGVGVWSVNFGMKLVVSYQLLW
jgi:hypothetical protein